MRQLARLFLRGSRYNKTMKDLDEKSNDQLNDLILQMRSMPEMRSCKEEFCRALNRTIGNDYLDRSAAEAEFDIAIMRAGVTVLFHQPVAKEVWKDPIQIKKIFQQWVFNYLRQILRENSIPSVLETTKTRMSGMDAAIAAVVERLQQHDLRFEMQEEQDEVVVKVNVDGMERDCLMAMNLMPHQAEDVAAAQKFVDLIKKSSCTLIVRDDRIIVRKLKDVTIEIEKKERKNVWAASFDANNDENEEMRDVLEWQALKRKGRMTSEEPEWMATLVDAVPMDALDVLRILVDPPSRFMDDYGSDSRYDERKIAKYLKQDLKHVREKMSTIRKTCSTLGVGPTLVCVICPECDNGVEIPRSFVDQDVECPNCMHRFTATDVKRVAFSDKMKMTQTAQ